MSKKPQYDPEEIRYPEQRIVESPLVPEMEQSYIEYAMSVIVGRALPDVRDGLKPVHRRILYAMYEDNLTSDKPFKKSATCVGDVLGRYHPHGDASVYDALVRLAQDFSMRYMLVDGHGNFGSVDGDPPAAYRYTEARLSKISDEMLRDIEKDTVDWDPNFDESRKEPRVLPARFPNLLVNGSSGIAVGMATNIPPHNLREVIGACICVLDDPNASLADLMEHIKGPDFPTKGIIMGRSGIRAAYATGRGRIVVRARHEFEEFGHDRTRIVITELPYQVNKRTLIKSLADQVEDKRLEGISDIRDESDRNGMRMVIELKRDANPQVVLNRLFSQSQLQTTFSINMLALVDNQHQPKILSLRHIIDEYLAFQEEIIVRRTRYDLKKAQERAHLLEGLLIAQDNIDEVIKIIRSAYDDAKQKLMERFGLDEIQAQAILDMRLKALQGLDREKLEGEYKELEERIAYFNRVLSDESLVRQILKEELTAIAEKFGDDRKTEIQDVEDEIDIEDLIEEEQCVFTLTEAGYIKRTPVSEYTAQSKGGMGKKGITTREEDTVVDVFTASTHDHILFFTDTGKVYRKKGYQIPESGKTAKGTNLINILQIEQGERVQAMLHYRETGEEQLYLMMVTRNGTVKRLPVEALKNLRNNGIRALTMDEGDQLVSVRETDGSQKILIATHDGMAVVFDENDVRPMGRSAMGVRGIRLREGDYVVGAARAREGKSVLTITEKGYGKRTPVEEYRITNRGGLGIKNYQITDKTGKIVGVKVVDGTEDLLLMTQSGILIRTPVENIKETANRATQGVIVMRFKEEGDSVISMALTEHEEDDDHALRGSASGTNRLDRCADEDARARDEQQILAAIHDLDADDAAGLLGHHVVLDAEAAAVRDAVFLDRRLLAVALFGDGQDLLALLGAGGADDIVALAVALADLGFVSAPGLHPAIVEPEGHIDALDLLDVVAVLEGFGEEGLALIILFQIFDGRFLVHLEGDDVLRLELAGKLSAQHGGVAAIGAGGGCCLGAADQLCAAGGAGSAAEASGLPLSPDRAIGRSLFGCFGGLVCLCLLLAVEGLYLCDIVGRAAVITAELAAGAVEPQWAGTGRALVIRGVFCHRSAPPFRRRRACRTRGRTSAGSWGRRASSRSSGTWPPGGACRTPSRICRCCVCRSCTPSPPRGGACRRRCRTCRYCRSVRRSSSSCPLPGRQGREQAAVRPSGRGPVC